MDEQNLKIGASMLDDLVKQVDTFEWTALRFADVSGENAILSPPEHAKITAICERILEDCDIVEKKIGSDPDALALLNYVKGRAYAVYLPGKIFPVPRVKSHKDQAISCYKKAIQLTSSKENKGLVSYYLAQLYDVWGNKQDAIINLEAAVNYLSVNDPLGMEAAKELERLKMKKKGMCFIATTVYGSPFADEVLILQNFRDNVLSVSTPGKFFVTCYYQISPFIAQVIAKSKVLKKVVKVTIILPLVKWVSFFSKYRDGKW